MSATRILGCDFYSLLRFCTTSVTSDLCLMLHGLWLIQEEIDSQAKPNNGDEELYPFLINLACIICTTISAKNSTNHHQNGLRPLYDSCDNKGYDCNTIDTRC